MKPNVYELRRVQKHIHAFPEEWNQEMWFRKRGCGTAMCFAGWACVLNGWEPRWGGHDATAAITKDGEWRNVEDVATKLLGLNGDQADELFCAINTREDIDRVVDELCEGEWS